MSAEARGMGQALQALLYSSKYLEAMSVPRARRRAAEASMNGKSSLQ
jgi:hypothetical protein